MFVPFSSGESVLVLIDACTRWPKGEILKSTTAKTVVHCLEKMRRSSPVIVLPWRIDKQQCPSVCLGHIQRMSHRQQHQTQKGDPLPPQANAEVGCSNKTLKKGLHTPYIEVKDWHCELYTFLHSYRATPHSVTGVPSHRISR